MTTQRQEYFMKRLPLFTLSLTAITLLSSATLSYAEETQTRAILLNPVIGAIPASQPQAVKLLIVSGEAKGCIATGGAYLSSERQRHEFILNPINCIKNGKKINVGQVVRGQHNIKGTMANSGMGRSYLVSNKGVTVTLAKK